MAEQKTKVTKISVAKFLAGIEDPAKRRDCLTLLKLMKKITKANPKVWGGHTVGFGVYHYKYTSGHEGDCFIVGFAPRRENITLYLMAGFRGIDELMSKLGKYKHSVSCLYIKKLSDIDQVVLAALIRYSVAYIKKTYPRAGGKKIIT